MKPSIFPEANGTLSGGPGADYGHDGDVADLPVHRSQGQVISCWSLSWRERLRVLWSGRVWLRVLARSSHPPVLLEAELPFERIA